MEKYRRIEDQRIRNEFDNIDFSDLKMMKDDAYFVEQASGQNAKKRKQELQPSRPIKTHQDPSRPMICNTCCKKFLYERSFDKHIDKHFKDMYGSEAVKEYQEISLEFKSFPITQLKHHP